MSAVFFILTVVVFVWGSTVESFLIRHDLRPNWKRRPATAEGAAADRRIPDDAAPQQFSDIPLMTYTDSSDEEFVWPIPLGHLPEPLRTCSIHQAPFTRTALQTCRLRHGPLCGFLFTDEMGCLAAMTIESDRILYRGECWFRIIQMETTIPYAVATVEWVAPPPPALEDARGDLVRLQDRLLEWAQLDLEKAQQPKNPLEESLLESPANMLQMAQERMAVIGAAPMEYLLDLVPDLVGFTNAQRCEWMGDYSIVVSDRLQYACGILEERLGMERARQLADSITDGVDDPAKDLKVGAPEIPPWAKQIRSGARLEYFWNVEIGWCAGTVTEDPVMIVDEWLINVRFDDDGSVHRLPLSADDKVRWRPLLG